MNLNVNENELQYLVDKLRVYCTKWSKVVNLDKTSKKKQDEISKVTHSNPDKFFENIFIDRIEDIFICIPMLNALFT